MILPSFSTETHTLYGRKVYEFTHFSQYSFFVVALIMDFDSIHCYGVNKVHSLNKT